MANPVFVSCAKGAWTKVATGVCSGTIRIHKAPARYVHTYRMTGETAPTSLDEGSPFSAASMMIANDNPIDVYVWCIGEVGQVKVEV